MVTGFNVNVKHDGKVYHVQTEDRGRRHPFIETLVYTKGKIIHQERISYEDQNDDSVYDEKAITRMVELQHKRIIQEIQEGRFDTDRKPFGEEFITSRTFDECVLAFLVDEARKPSLILSIVGQSDFVPGSRAHVVVRATTGASGEAIAGAKIHGRIILSTEKPSPLAEAVTDAAGEARVEFVVPPAEGNAALIVQAESELGRDEVQRLIH